MKVDQVLAGQIVKVSSTKVQLQIWEELKRKFLWAKSSLPWGELFEGASRSKGKIRDHKSATKPIQSSISLINLWVMWAERKLAQLEWHIIQAIPAILPSSIITLSSIWEWLQACRVEEHRISLVSNSQNSHQRLKYINLVSPKMIPKLVLGQHNLRRIYQKFKLALDQKWTCSTDKVRALQQVTTHLIKRCPPRTLLEEDLDQSRHIKHNKFFRITWYTIWIQKPTAQWDSQTLTSTTPILQQVVAPIRNNFSHREMASKQ